MEKRAEFIIKIIIALFIFLLWILLAFNTLNEQIQTKKNTLCDFQNNITIEKYIINNTNKLLEDELNNLNGGYKKNGEIFLFNRTKS